MLVHRFRQASLSHALTHLLEAGAEALEDGADVSALLHTDDARVILLVDPHQKVLLLVVPDAARVGPVTCHARRQQQRRHRLVEQEVVLSRAETKWRRWW